jgi:hypothetical protein
MTAKEQICDDFLVVLSRTILYHANLHIIKKKTQPGREKPSSPTSARVGTQGAHNPLITKKSGNQHIPVEKTLEL